MTLTVNGTRRDVPDGASVGDLVDEVAEDRRGVAVAVDGEVVPRSRWDVTTLTDGAVIEVLTAAQGG